MESERPKMGIGVLVTRGDTVLLGKRISGFGSGNWMIPGGHLERGESFEACAMRELAEEAGLVGCKPVGVVSISNDIAYDTHYVSIGVHLEWVSGEPFSSEPDKSHDWHWHDPNQLPENMFVHSRKVIENWLAGKIYSP